MNVHSAGSRSLCNPPRSSLYTGEVNVNLSYHKTDEVKLDSNSKKVEMYVSQKPLGYPHQLWRSGTMCRTSTTTSLLAKMLALAITADLNGCVKIQISNELF